MKAVAVVPQRKEFEYVKCQDRASLQEKSLREIRIPLVQYSIKLEGV